MRRKGASYLHAGAVSNLRTGTDDVDAVVHGSRDYRVHVRRQGETFTASCDCPFFEDRLQICKHIWAVLLVADDRQLLGINGLPPPGLRLIPDAGALVADASAAATTSSSHGADPPASDATQGSPPGAPAWGRVLDDVREAVSAGERVAVTSRFLDQQILYVIEAGSDSTTPGVRLRVLTQQRKKSGEWSRPKPAWVSPRELPTLADEADREILSLLSGAETEWAHRLGYASLGGPEKGVFRVAAPIVLRVLPLVAATGRARLARPDGALEPIAWDPGPPWRFDVTVVEAREGDRYTFTIDGAFVRPGGRLGAREPSAVMMDGFLIADGRLARLDDQGGLAWVIALRRSGAVSIPAEATDSLLEALARSGVAPERLPPVLRYTLSDVVPRPCVCISRRPPTAYDYHTRESLQAHVHFDYDGTAVEAGPGRLAYDAALRRVIRRALDEESRAVHRLQQLGFHYVYDYGHNGSVLIVAVDQFPRAVRTLVNEGWRVEADGRVFRPARQLEMRVTTGVDWFELRGRADFGDGRSLPVPELLAAIRRGEGTVLLDDGSRGVVPEEWLQRYVGIARFGEASGDHVRFRPSQTALLDALLASQAAVSVDEAFNRARTALATFERIAPLDAPAGFHGALRLYQREALGWFAYLRRFGFGGCLADDMGLGKTVMVLALLVERASEQRAAADRPGTPAARPSLAIVPRSLVYNWIDEARRFAPSLRILDYTGSGRSLEPLAAHDLVVTTYGTLRRDAALLREIAFDYVILDEAQAVKNAGTASAKAVRLLGGDHRLALSGTPVENHLGELRSLFQFLNPGLLGSAASPLLPAGRGRLDRENMTVIARAVRPFILRRTKEQVAPELPERTEQTIHCELEGAQRRLYDQLRDHYRRALSARIARSGLNRSRIQVLEALLRLRQAACHQGLVDEARIAEPCAKLDVLVPRLGEIVDEGHKALVFSQFTSFLAILRRQLDSHGLVYEYLDGATTDRAARVVRFRSDPRCGLFLISLKAGGLGLNLTEAEYVFLLDPWWNPAVEAQAIDRAHRIGQARQVFAYRLIARETVEEKVAELQASKREVADAILSENAGPLQDLSPEDLAWLLS
ncbi:MAG TPA: DEAD/DEAH box helicase [Vicinamibacterales bacterium]|nr:DEAD/DEAH box helicase [Vicinamibacterales bacterium]